MRARALAAASAACVVLAGALLRWWRQRRCLAAAAMDAEPVPEAARSAKPYAAFVSHFKAEAAMEAALKQYGGGSTDYGTSMMDLAEATLDAVDKKTTILVLGDARSNYGDPGHLVLKEFYERAGRVIFLNPEPESVWDSGDSEMKKLGAYCTHKQTCNSVKHVERVLDDLLRLSS